MRDSELVVYSIDFDLSLHKQRLIAVGGEVILV